MIESFILIVHVLAAVFMIGLILLQQGKGAEAGASFGAGSSQTVFGAAGATSFLTKLTWGLSLTFFATSLLLAFFARQHLQSAATVIPGLDVPAATVASAPVKPVGDVPTTPALKVAPVSKDVPAAPAASLAPATTVASAGIAAPKPVTIAPAAGSGK